MPLFLYRLLHSSKKAIRMKYCKWILLLFSFTCLVQSCTKSIVGEGPVQTENRQVANFTKVKINGSAEVEIIQSNTQKVSITGYGNLLAIYESQVNNGELSLGYKSRYNIKNDNIKIRIEVADIRSVYLNGSGDIIITNFMLGVELASTINGSGRVRVQNSSFTKMAYHINGSGSMYGAGIAAQQVEVSIHGSGHIELNCSQHLKVNIQGSGTVDYYGNPATTDISIHGSGIARKK